MAFLQKLVKPSSAFSAGRNYATGKGKYEGLSYDRVTKIRAERLNPSANATAYYKQPLLITRGENQYLWDVEGRKYLDLFAGIVTVSVGHCHPKVNEAAKKQMDTLWHTTTIYMTSPVHEYAEKLTAKLPDKLKVCYFVNSGSEANDLALMLCRLHTGNYDIVSLRNAYHGLTNSVMGITNIGTWKQPTPTSFGIHRTVNADPYRGPWGGARCRDSPIQTDRQCDCKPGQCKASDEYVNQLEDLLNHGVPKKGVAGFIIESIQGVGGSVQYPKGYVKRAFDLIRARGGICISDEVQTGFGRTGDHFWGFEAHDVVPDIVTMAKGIGNGFPMGAVVTTAEVAKSLTFATHFNTFGGNPVACAVGSAVLDVIEEEGLQKNSLEVGTHFLQRLAELKKEIRQIGDVRGKGLMIGMEMVEDRETKKPLEIEKIQAAFNKMKDYGVLVGLGGLHRNVFRIKPPMTITKADADMAVDVMKRALKEVL